MDLISVIVPVYNVERYLYKCIDSILNQTYLNLQIILVDDGSTDSSGMICDEYKMKDSRVQVIHKNNGGLSDARNFGIDEAKGSYYAFIDSDDFIEKDMIESMYCSVKKESVDIAVCNMKRIYEDGDTDTFYEPYNSETTLLGKERYVTLNQPSVCNKLFSAILFDKVRFPKGRYYEDTFIYHILLYRANGAVLTGKVGYWYLDRKGSILGRNQFTVRYFDFIEAVYDRMSFFIEMQEKEPAVTASLSYYAAYSNAVKNIEHTEDTEKKFALAEQWYRIAYDFLMRSDTTNTKQKVRLILLKYFPKLHALIY